MTASLKRTLVEIDPGVPEVVLLSCARAETWVGALCTFRDDGAEYVVGRVFGATLDKLMSGEICLRSAMQHADRCALWSQGQWTIDDTPRRIPEEMLPDYGFLVSEFIEGGAC